LGPGEEGLLHLTWKNRETNAVEDDLIIFPGEATFQKVGQSPEGRTFVLKFSSSDQKHFFWIQDATTYSLDDLERNVNGLLQDPTFQPRWSTDSSAAQVSTATTNTVSTNVLQQASSAQDRVNDETARLADQLRNLLQGRGRGLGSSSDHQPPLALSDMLTPTNIAPLLRTLDSRNLAVLQDHLPADLPKDLGQTPEEIVRRVIESVPFQLCVRQLDRALSTGLLGGLMAGFSLPAEAGLSVVTFLDAIQEQARKDEEAE